MKKKLEFLRSKYQYSNTLAVVANNSDGSPYGVATIYIEGDSEGLARDEAFVDTNNWPDVDKTLVDLGLATLVPGKCAQSGFCVYPAMKFNLDKIRQA